MPLEAEPSASDFLTLIAWWNLYGLPALLTVVALVLAIRQYNRPDAGQDRLAEAIGTNNPRNSETQDHRRRPRIKIAPETRLLADLHHRPDANHGVIGSWLRFPVFSVRSWRTPWD
jgi:hypothetical protein